MEIETKHLGAVTIEEEDITRFPQGIPAFEDERDFVFLPFDDSGSLFIMQSVQHAHIAFITADPFVFFPDYELEVPDAVTEQLHIENPEQVLVYVTLTLANTLEDSTANLQAPLIINVEQKLGKQWPMAQSPYETKHLLFQRTKKEGTGSC